MHTFRRNLVLPRAFLTCLLISVVTAALLSLPAAPAAAPDLASLLPR